MYKATGFLELDTYSSPDFSSSEWDEPYALDADDSFFDKHHHAIFPPPRRRFPAHAFASAPDLKRVSLTLPSTTADDLRPNDVLIVPPLVHLHIRIYLSYARTEDLRAAVPASMTFGDLSKQIIHSYVSSGVRSCDVTARAEQRERMKEPSPSTTLEDLIHRGEVLRDERREMKVEIMMEDDEERVCAWRGYGGREPRSGAVANAEMARKREVSRTRVAHV